MNRIEHRSAQSSSLEGQMEPEDTTRTHSASRAVILVGLSLFLLLAALRSSAQDAGRPQQPVPFGNCGPKPVVTCEAPSTCEKSSVYGGRWIPGKPLAKGASCIISSKQGSCDGAGTCVALPAGPSGTIAPEYYLLAVVYPPPGSKSTAIYLSGAGVGTTSDISEAFGTGFTAGVVGNVVITDNYQMTYQNDYTVQITDTSATGINVISKADAVDHTQDMFYLWTNPLLQYSQTYKGKSGINIGFGINGTQGVQVNTVSVAQVMGLETDFAGVMTNYTAADKANLLAQDPFLAKGYVLDPNRFIFDQEVQLDGPAVAGAGVPDHGTPIQMSTNSTTCTKDTVSTQNTVSFGGTAGVDFFGAGEKQNSSLH